MYPIILPIDKGAVNMVSYHNIETIMGVLTMYLPGNVCLFIYHHVI